MHQQKSKLKCMHPHAMQGKQSNTNADVEQMTKREKSEIKSSSYKNR